MEPIDVPNASRKSKEDKRSASVKEEEEKHVDFEEDVEDKGNEIEKGNINELRKRTDSADKREIQKAMEAFPTYGKPKDENRDRRSSSIVMSKMVLNDPASTLRSTTKAQAKLGYTQTSAMLTWQNISCDNDNDIRLFPTCGYVKPGQMLCVLGGGDTSGIADLFRILRDPSRIYRSKDNGTYVAHGDILLNGLPPGKFYKRFVLPLLSVQSVFIAAICGGRKK